MPVLLRTYMSLMSAGVVRSCRACPHDHVVLLAVLLEARGPGARPQQRFQRAPRTVSDVGAMSESLSRLTRTRILRRVEAAGRRAGFCIPDTSVFRR